MEYQWAHRNPYDYGLGDDAVLFVWDLSNGTQRQRISRPFFGAICSLALIDYIPESPKIAIVGSGDGSITTYREDMAQVGYIFFRSFICLLHVSSSNTHTNSVITSILSNISPSIHIIEGSPVLATGYWHSWISMTMVCSSRSVSHSKNIPLFFN